jgi:hypothetical protein
MPVLEKFRGIVVRLIYDRTLGARLHAFYEGAELVVALQPLRVLQGDVPQWVREWVLGWAREHKDQVVQFVETPLTIARWPLPSTNVGWAYPTHA